MWNPLGGWRDPCHILGMARRVDLTVAVGSPDGHRSSAFVVSMSERTADVYIAPRLPIRGIDVHISHHLLRGIHHVKNQGSPEPMPRPPVTKSGHEMLGVVMIDSRGLHVPPSRSAPDDTWWIPDPGGGASVQIATYVGPPTTVSTAQPGTFLDARQLTGTAPSHVVTVVASAAEPLPSQSSFHMPQDEYADFLSKRGDDGSTRCLEWGYLKRNLAYLREGPINGIVPR